MKYLIATIIILLLAVSSSSVELQNAWTVVQAGPSNPSSDLGYEFILGDSAGQCIVAVSGTEYNGGQPIDSLYWSGQKLTRYIYHMEISGYGNAIAMFVLDSVGIAAGEAGSTKNDTFQVWLNPNTQSNWGLAAASYKHMKPTFADLFIDSSSLGASSPTLPYNIVDTLTISGSDYEDTVQVTTAVNRISWGYLALKDRSGDTAVVILSAVNGDAAGAFVNMNQLTEQINSGFASMDVYVGDRKISLTAASSPTSKRRRLLLGE